MKSDVLCVKDAVAEVLRDSVRARNDDHWLVFCVLKKMGFGVFIPFGEMKDMPSFESITRCRRKFQEEGLFKASAVVADERDAEREEMHYIHNWFGGSDVGQKKVLEERKWP